MSAETDGLDPVQEEERRTRRKGHVAGLVSGAVVVALVALMLLVLGMCGGPDEPSTTTVTPSPAAPPVTPLPIGDGIVRAGNAVMLPLSGPASLRDYADFNATGTSVPVQSVPADEGFWVGTSPDDRLWVQLVHVDGESPFVVKASQRVAFTGKVAANGAGFADRAGVTAAEGATMLQAQGYHVAVAKSALRILP